MGSGRSVQLWRQPCQLDRTCRWHLLSIPTLTDVPIERLPIAAAALDRDGAILVANDGLCDCAGRPTQAVRRGG